MRSLALPVLALCVVALGAPGAAAQSLGRLFSTPEERLMLDDARRQYELGGPVVEEVSTKPEPEQRDPVVSELTINGVVLRSSGVNAAWINGNPVLGGVTREGLRVRAGPESGVGVRITLPSGVETVQLRPGQKIDVVSGSVLEVYEQQGVDDAESAFAEPGAASPEGAAPTALDPGASQGLGEPGS